MENQNIVIGVIIGILIGALGGYLLFNDSNQEDPSLTQSQISDLTEQIIDLTQQVNDLTQQVTDLDQEVTDLTQQLNSKEQKLQFLETQLNQKNELISDLRLIIESNQQEDVKEETENLAQEQYYINKTWESTTYMTHFNALYTENVTLHGNPLTFSWTRPLHDADNVFIQIFDAETNYDYRKYTLSDISSPYVTEAIPEGEYYFSVKSGLPFSFHVKETP